MEFCKGQYKVLFFSTLACSTCFFEKYECDIASYTDDNTSRTNDSDLYTYTLVLSKLNKCADSFFTLFKEIHMKANGDKCHLIITTENQLV